MKTFIIGKICLQQSIPSSSNFEGIMKKFRLNGFIFPIIFGSLIVFWTLKVKAMIKTQCSTFKTFSCYGGKYRRNLQTFKENLAQSAYWISFLILENVLVVFLRMFSDVIKENTIFLIYNIYFFIFGDIAIGFLLPMRYLMLSKRNYQILWMSNLKEKNNVMEKSNDISIKIPRRDTTPTMIIKPIESMKNRGKNKDIYQNIGIIPLVTVVEIE